MGEEEGAEGEEERIDGFREVQGSEIEETGRFEQNSIA